MAQAPNELHAIDALAQMAAGRLTAEALTRACLDRIAARDAVVRRLPGWIRSARSTRHARATARAGRGRRRHSTGCPSA